ncbi:MAG: hypothetical protein C4K60_20895 [Ideonella sp. MAG2]|nr:MAG: hypothetical protein C4K60_20895 [Ideonella sp. MAG2]
MVLAAGTIHVQANDFDASIAKARENVQSGNYAKALDEVRRARTLNSRDYRSYYYEAMAQLGLGQKTEARAAVQAAQERAPASAKEALQKLAQLTTDAGPSTPAVAPPSTAIIVSCTFSGKQKKYYRNEEEEKEMPEKTQIFRIENGKFEYWNSDRNYWGNMAACSRSQTETQTEKLSDGRTKTTSRYPVKCNLTADLFSSESNSEFSFSSIGSSRDITRSLDRYTINRLTGAYTAETITSWTEGRDWTETYRGFCRAAKDPSITQPKF